jgi:serine/threonine-protein kinase
VASSWPEFAEKTLEIRARARLGSTLNGKYRLDRLLGVGGMASVYAATHRNTKRFAVKVLHPELSLNEDLRVRFVREGYLANSVGHPGAVAVLDEDTSEGETFLVMELLDGEAIDELATRLGGRLSPRVALAVADALLDVLTAAHARSIVHRDIKPANVFLTSSGELKVLDFGVARIRDASGNGTTRSGLTMGTPAFMAPEQALARPAEIDGRTDVWSVGATLYSLLSGRQVHQAASGQEAMIWTATRQAPSLFSVAPELPVAIVSVVDKALAFARSDRWESAAAMQEAVRAAFLEIEGEALSGAILTTVAPAPHVQLASRELGETIADPMGPTAVGPAFTPPEARRVSSSSPQATSVVANSVAKRRPQRGRLAIAAIALVAIGAIAGSIASRFRGERTSVSGAPSAGAPDPAKPPAEAAPGATTAAPSAAPVSSGTAIPVRASATAPIAPPTPVGTGQPRGRGGPPNVRPAAQPSASASSPRDEFDHQ